MRSMRLLVFVLAALALAGACAPQAAAPAEEEAAVEEKGAIRVGFVTSLSGVVAESAKDMVDGWNLWWEQNGNVVAGREVQTLLEDDAADPSVALSKARLLVEQRKVHMMTGMLLANVGLAVTEYTGEQEIPTFVPVACPDDLSQRNRIEYHIRTAGWSCSQPSHPFGEWVARNTDCRNVYTIGSDYAFGHEVVGGFVNTFTDSGGGVVEQAWNPIGEADFSSYLVTIAAAEPDCVFALEVGATAPRFIKAYTDFGLRETIPLFLGEVPADQSILRGIDPPELAEGLISSGHYAEGRDSPATQDFVRAYDERYGRLPSYYSVSNYVAAQWLTRAIEAVDGNVEDKEAFLEAVRAVEFADTALGPIKLDEFDNPIQNIYIRQVELRDDGRPWNKVIDTIPSVSQFYKYDQDAFLEQPVYSRDYQGIDWP